MEQLHDLSVFFLLPSELNKKEKEWAMESLVFLVEKQDCTLKARAYANRSTQREYTSKDDATSTTVSTELVIVTNIIEVKQSRDVAIVDIPNAFIQIAIQKGNGQDRIMMKIKGKVIDILVEISPETYGNYVVFKKV